MNDKKRYIIAALMIILVVVVIFGMIKWNEFSNENNNEIDSSSTFVDVEDINNVPVVDEKLGETMKITQNYLITYTRNKSSIWYMSSAKVKKITIDGNDAFIVLTNEDGSKSINATIDSSKVEVKKDDVINFVGTIDLENGYINLSKISKEIIDYSNVTKLDFNELVDNIKKVLSNEFVVSGYMITDGDKYKLYKNKKEYENNPGVGNYFTLIWKDEFNLTGNANVTVKCLIGDTFKLKECELME